MTRRVTIGDLARELQISKSAVSYALNGVPGVSATTRKRVVEHARTRGWRPHATARALSGGRSGAIGLVLARSPELIANEPFYSLVIAGMEKVLIRRGNALLLRMVDDNGADLQVYRELAAERRVDGVALFDAMADDPRVALLQELGLPAVLHGEFPSAAGLACVAPDEESDTRTIISHLRERGYERLVHLSGPTTFRHETVRTAALRRQAAAAGMDFEALAGSYSYECGQRLGQNLIARSDSSTAVVCSDDLLALGVLSAAREAGCPVPDRLAVVSWDDSLACQVAHPAVTALDRHTIEVGSTIAELLLRIIDGGDPVSTRQRPADMVVRAST